MMRGQALLVWGVLLAAAMETGCVLLLNSVTDLSGGLVFALSLAAAFFSFLLFVFIVTKSGM